MMGCSQSKTIKCYVPRLLAPEVLQCFWLVLISILRTFWLELVQEILTKGPWSLDVNFEMVLH